MKLYYMQGSCSLAVHVALREAGFDFRAARLDKATRVFDDGQPIASVNDRGYVPVLELDDGARLVEVASILQWVADQRPDARLAPAAGTRERYRLVEWLSFVGMEVHKIYWPLFHDGAPVENEKALEKLGRSFTWVEKQLGERGPWLLGEQFTVADCYLGTTLNWARPAKIDLARWPLLADYLKRWRERPTVQAAMEAEGILRRK